MKQVRLRITQKERNEREITVKEATFGKFPFLSTTRACHYLLEAEPPFPVCTGSRGDCAGPGDVDVTRNTVENPIVMFCNSER